MLEIEKNLWRESNYDRVSISAFVCWRHQTPAQLLEPRRVEGKLLLLFNGIELILALGGKSYSSK